jgi:hypothetical protein
MNADKDMNGLGWAFQFPYIISSLLVENGPISPVPRANNRFEPQMDADKRRLRYRLVGMGKRARFFRIPPHICVHPRPSAVRFH